MENVVHVGCLKNEKSIKGEIKKIIFKADNNYFIASFKTDDIPEYAMSKIKDGTCIITGTFANIFESEHLELFGKWVKHPKFGYQFKASNYNQIIPKTKDGIEQYLASGMFKGIGPKTAKKIVDYFGEDTLKVIDTEPDRLAEIKGISATKVSQVIRDYEETEKVRKLIIKLKPYNISNNNIIKISKKYGDKAMEKIIENPYRLCDDISGIGFNIADRVARACNIGPNDDFRIRAGILHCLKSFCSDGHCFLPYKNFLEETKKILETGNISGTIDINNIIRIALIMKDKKEIIMDKESCTYLPSMYNAEKYIAEKVIKMAKVPVESFKQDLNTTIEKLQKDFNITYAEQQKEAFYSFAKSNILVITGGPGTGKTTIINGLINIYKSNFKGANIALAAPTGRAAKRMQQATNLEAKTIHRLLEYQPMNEPPFTRNETNPIEADLAILDEASMIDLPLMEKFLKAVTTKTKLVIVGDVDQLPSVGPGNVLRDLIESNAIPMVRLDKIFRQEDTSKIILNAYTINKGDLHLEFGDDFIYINEEDPNNIPNIIDKIYLEELSKIKDIQEIQVLSPIRKRTTTGVEQLNISLQKLLNPHKQNSKEIKSFNNIFRKYDKVMQYKNNYEKDVYNGDIGIITNVSSDSIDIKIEDKTISYYKNELDEIQLSYASTIHKSQGSEYKVVIIPMSLEYGRMLQRNLIYTGVTRAKEKVIIVGSRKALAISILNNKTTTRYSKLKERILEIE